MERTNKDLNIDLRWDLKHGLLIKHLKIKPRYANADAKLQKSVMK